jgi:hypothetical protein
MLPRRQRSRPLRACGSGGVNHGSAVERDGDYFGSSRLASDAFQPLLERTTGIEPATLSLGSPSPLAQHGGFRLPRASVRASQASQMDSRSAFAAACRRSLTSASSRAARSIRSCWVSARSCASSASPRSPFSCSAISSTFRVRSASWPAISAVSSLADIAPGFYARIQAVGVDLTARVRFSSKRSAASASWPFEHMPVSVGHVGRAVTDVVADPLEREAGVVHR